MPDEEVDRDERMLTAMAEVVRERKRRRQREVTDEAYQDWLETKAYERDHDHEN